MVDDELGMREVLSVLFSRAGYAFDVESNGERGVKRILESAPYDVVLTDLVMPGADGMEVLSAAKERCAETQVIMITAHGTRETAVQALQGGAYDYVMKPFKTQEIRLLVERALEKRRLLRENLDLRREVEGRFEAGRIVGTSRAMRQVIDLCKRLGELRTNVLVTGESGTGKELVARALHSFGPRAGEPFVTVNCGALPENLMESELFGHEKGAFTGAVCSSDGLFREADGGTLLLDEIGELPMPLQVKLLRVLQERSVRPVGSGTEQPVDVRIVAASNRDLEQEVEDRRFRSDLFYRLNVVRIDIPPLRKRREDIPVLIEHFFARYSSDVNRRVKGFTPEALQRLLDYRFPGNIRELENIVERAVALSTDEQAGLRSLPPSLVGIPETPLPTWELPDEGLNLDEKLAEVERSYLRKALERSEGVQTKAAELLGISFRSFRYRLRKLGLDPEVFSE